MSIAAANPTQYRASFSSGNNAVQQVHLPKIVHSGARTGDPTALNITARGVSRASSLGDIVDRINDENNSGRPLPYEFDDDSTYFDRHKNKLKKSNSISHSFTPNGFKNDSSYSIPDNVKTVYTPDVTKPSMPIFGNRPETIANPSGNNVKVNRSIPSTPTFQKAEIDEIMILLKERIRTSFHEIKTKFKNGDPDGKGVISKDAFAHILAAILGPSKPLSHQQFNKLLERLDFKNKNLIKFDDFVGVFQENKNETSTWFDPVRANAPTQQSQNSVVRKATQVYVIIKEKCKLKSKEMTDLIPQINGGSGNRIFKPELLNAINAMNIKMDLDEYDKLWKKFDNENIGVVHSESLLKRLGLNEFLPAPSPRVDYKPEVPLPNIPSNDAAKLQSVSRSSNKNPIEKWLKRRFREGFSSMKQAFQEIDRNKTGQIKREQFLSILKKFGLRLETSLLDAFLQRCDIDIQLNDLIPYTKFLEKFQNRSEQGLTYKVITNNGNIGRAESAIGQVEKKLLKMFQKDFLSLLTIFRKIDRNKTNSILKKEFRAAIESHFAVEMTDTEFEEFIKDIPVEDGRVKYLEFMSRFDTEDTGSLFDSESIQGDITPPLRRKADWDTIQEENEDVTSPRDEVFAPTGRSQKELREIIKNQIRNNYKEVESKWSNIDEGNSGELTKDTLYQLLKSLKINPQVTRSEIDALWGEFILKDNNKLEYWQFIRSFGYSKKSGAFTNAKRAPPKKGDADMMLTSNKLGRDSILIRGSVHAKLRLHCESLRKSFNEIDPYHTGYILRDEYRELLLEFCPELNDDEFDVLCEKYENPFDGRINYTLFLQPYTVPKDKVAPASFIGSMTSRETAREALTSRIDTNDPLIQKLRFKLQDRIKDLKRIFKNKDTKQAGSITINAFKECLVQAKMSLNDEEIYNLHNKLDKDMSGLINYNKFINDFLKP